MMSESASREAGRSGVDGCGHQRNKIGHELITAEAKHDSSLYQSLKIYVFKRRQLQHLKKILLKCETRLESFSGIAWQQTNSCKNNYYSVHRLS